MNDVNHEAHRRGADGEPVRLGALEAQVMEVLWQASPQTVREIIEQLAAPAAYTTIATVLTNLRKKGLVCTRKDGHATLYGACQSREEHAANIMDHALTASGDRAASILHFVNTMPEDDVALLKQLLLGEKAD
ncbi:BlaI/MecI/CopY family transcriptional regulator [Leucobacter sp. UCMA 4100]|uniref:BlaI/MecI/CopY family transcriptional regulator n=1 Tax=Leucobacter sp. UCMA 4100 TaxID=2810534 RepID=UPI0022EB7C01|nr:BlaI/MecI/CopY family transcriptional regulator [Leucobacter sp. UCMA 4100]MDA3147502.1 BlaI/MecI/CopY family transcriptional regulator [Leucobacter sp. UCMA 4100]